MQGHEETSAGRRGLKEEIKLSVVVLVSSTASMRMCEHNIILCAIFTKQYDENPHLLEEVGSGPVACELSIVPVEVADAIRSLPTL